MLRNFIFLLCCSCGLALHAQLPAKGVKTVSRYMVAWGDKGDSTVKFLASSTEYDAKGRTVKDINYRANDFSPTPTDSSSPVYYSYRGGLYTSFPQKLEEFRYDARDSLVSRAQEGPTYFLLGRSQHTYSYGSDGRLKEIVRSDNGTIAARTSFSYNAKGQCVKESYTVLRYPEYSTVTTYRYDAKGNLISKADRKLSGELDDSAYYEYDAQNRRILEMEWNGKRLEDSTRYIFHDKGKTRVQFRPFFWSGETPKAWKHEVAEYDLQGNRRSIIRTEYKITDLREMAATKPDEIDSTTYTYWPGGKLRSIRVATTKNNATKLKELSTFNENGDLLEKLRYGSRGVEDCERYTYDAAGRKIRSEHTGQSLVHHQYHLYFYDSKGLLKEERVFSIGGRLQHKMYYTYTFF